MDSMTNWQYLVEMWRMGDYLMAARMAVRCLIMGRKWPCDLSWGYWWEIRHGK